MPRAGGSGPGYGGGVRKNKPAPKTQPEPKNQGGGGTNRNRDKNKDRHTHGKKADSQSNLLPGVYGEDFDLIVYKGRYYVRYDVALGSTKTSLIWRVEDADFEGLGLDRRQARQVSSREFENLNFFGDSKEIQARGDDRHPFKRFLSELRIQYPGASWLEDEEVLSVFLEGHIENLDPDDVLARVKNTRWYQTRTQEQRWWELEATKAEKNITLKQSREAVQEMLTDEFGPISWRDHITPEELDEFALNVASGAWGTQQEAMTFLERRIRDRARKIEGTAAWVNQQQTDAETRAYTNRPEDEYERLRSVALEWLGPSGVPDDNTLKRWARDIVAATASDADFMQYLRRQAQALYPYLDPDEPWQDRAGSYKRLAEEEMGVNLNWDDDILSDLNATDASGVPINAPLTQSAFRRRVRQDDRWWRSDRARDEGANLLSYLNEQFTGAGN